jgi:hypothetical protein
VKPYTVTRSSLTTSQLDIFFFHRWTVL